MAKEKVNLYFIAVCPDVSDNNPYAPVREEEWTEDINGFHIVHNAKGRVVGLSTIHFRGDKQVGHAVQFVEADGYWHGAGPTMKKPVGVAKSVDPLWKARFSAEKERLYSRT